MSDLLSAASLLLTALTIIYGLWYPQMVTVLDITPPDHREDRIKPYREVHQVIKTRVVPLLVISGLLTLVFLPDSWRLVCLSLRDFSSRRFASVQDYDAIATSFVLVTCLLGFLTAHLFAVTAQLLRLLSRLKP